MSTNSSNVSSPSSSSPGAAPEPESGKPSRVVIAREARELARPGRRFCIAIGFFDGVHIGHQRIIGQTIADARQHDALPVVVTFEPHPSTVVAPERVPPLIYSLSQKLRAIESLGAGAVLLLYFDHALSRQTGEVFIRNLARDVGSLQSVCVGENFVFGWQRSGNVTLLKVLGRELHFTVHGLPAVIMAGQKVSSTRIRQAILSGHLQTASDLIGRPYSVAGTVVAGDKLGRELGFPTANLDTVGRVLPPNGVYLGHADVNGVRREAVLNIGHRPTVAPNSLRQFEAHFLDFHGDLYGQELEVFIGDKLRDEKKFASVTELSEQIARDVREARARFAV